VWCGTDGDMEWEEEMAHATYSQPSAATTERSSVDFDYLLLQARSKLRHK